MLGCRSPDICGVNSLFQLTGFMLFCVLSLNSLLWSHLSLLAFINNFKSVKKINNNNKRTIKPVFGWREKPGNIIQIQTKSLTAKQVK